MNKINLIAIIMLFAVVSCSTLKKRNYPEKQTQVIELTDEMITTEEFASESDQFQSAEDELDTQMPEETQAAVVQRKLFDLGRNPSQTAINNFRYSLDRCFVSVITQLEEDDYYDKGLSYMIIPSGAIYPFSKTEVHCLAGSPYAEDIGGVFCEKFFECVGEKYSK